MKKNYLKIAGGAVILFCCLLSGGIASAQNKKPDLRTRQEGTLFGAILNLFHKEEVRAERLITGSIASEGFTTLPYVRSENSDYVSNVNYDGDFVIRVPLNAKKLVIGAPGLLEKTFDLDDAESHYHILLRAEGGSNPRQPGIYGMKIDPRSFNGAHTTLTANDIRIRNSVTLDEVLVGSVPGLTVSGIGNGVASNFRYTIRGRGSLMSSTDPLVILDGAPYSGALNTINPNDVQYLTVLRDAVGKAVFGMRGANGIIIITTKSGVDDNVE